MDLWIRSQDKTILIEVNNLLVNDERVVLLAKTGGRATIGKYKTRERALEVLDEIQSKISQQFLVKPNQLMRLEDIDNFETSLKRKYNQEFIMQDSGFKIEPINIGIVVYEMPEE